MTYSPLLPTRPKPRPSVSPTDSRPHRWCCRSPRTPPPAPSASSITSNPTRSRLFYSLFFGQSRLTEECRFRTPCPNCRAEPFNVPAAAPRPCAARSKRVFLVFLMPKKAWILESFFSSPSRSCDYAASFLESRHKYVFSTTGHRSRWWARRYERGSYRAPGRRQSHRDR